MPLVSTIVLCLLAMLLGVFVGTLTGLIPGLHVNTAAFLFVSLISSLLSANPLLLTPAIVFIMSAAITHTFLDFIPSIFVGAPDESTCLSVLPGHRLTLRGYGYVALVYSALSGLFGSLFAVLFLPLLLSFGNEVYNTIKSFIPYILIGVMFILLLGERKKVSAAIILLLSCFLGIVVLSLPMTSGDALVSMLTGLFGLSTIIMSIYTSPSIKRQKLNFKINWRDITSNSLLGSVAGILSGLLPGITPTQSSIIVAQLKRRMSERSFIAMLGSANTVHAFIAVMSIFIISKPRSGVAIALQSLGMGKSSIPLLILCTVVSASLATVITIVVGRRFASDLTEINYGKLGIAILLFLMILTFIQASFLGGVCHVNFMFARNSCLPHGGEEEFTDGCAHLSGNSELFGMMKLTHPFVSCGKHTINFIKILVSGVKKVHELNPPSFHVENDVTLKKVKFI